MLQLTSASLRKPTRRRTSSPSPNHRVHQPPWMLFNAFTNCGLQELLSMCPRLLEHLQHCWCCCIAAVSVPAHRAAGQDSRGMVPHISKYIYAPKASGNTFSELPTRSRSFHVAPDKRQLSGFQVMPWKLYRLEMKRFIWLEAGRLHVKNSDLKC